MSKKTNTRNPLRRVSFCLFLKVSERMTQKVGLLRKPLSTREIGLSGGPEDQQSHRYLLSFSLKHYLFVNRLRYFFSIYGENQMLPVPALPLAFLRCIT
jgi:hypothetical protein